MHIKPRYRGFICTTSHPVGCSQWVEQKVRDLRKLPPIQGPRKVLVIGASAGYGLATRLVATFAAGADTVGVFLEKPSRENRTATAGWYLTSALERLADQSGRIAHSVCGDAFSEGAKRSTMRSVREKLGSVDLLVYSLAAPRRFHPSKQAWDVSVLKPIGASFCSKTLDFHTAKVDTITVDPASEEEIAGTVSVMGGEDLKLWVEALKTEGLLSPGVRVLAYSYVGPSLTHPIYRLGTVGRAKDHLEATVNVLDRELRQQYNGRALISVNKAVVTQSSAAIPVVPLYLSLLYRVMQERTMHEDTVQQMYRLLAEALYPEPKGLDEKGRLRMDDREMDPGVQREVEDRFVKATDATIGTLGDVDLYRKAFAQLFGFAIPGVDYDLPVDPQVSIPSVNGSCFLRSANKN
ncbi:enoyl-ACP reductase FabV [Pasteuria penetrans]|uniref:enoyl-ACP reductase FabV n=1 Tax=Pasteuria penetrans TaxID=86005 RepID=UPI000FA9485C|nr:enoyl-ACP reductase FabV [Pasteuria penetrans]